MRKRKPGKEWRYIYEGDEGHDNRPDYPDRSEYHPDTYGCGDALHRMPVRTGREPCGGSVCARH